MSRSRSHWSVGNVLSVLVVGAMVSLTAWACVSSHNRVEAASGAGNFGRGAYATTLDDDSLSSSAETGSIERPWWYVIDPLEGTYYWDENNDLVPDAFPWDLDRDGQIDRDYTTPRFETEADRYDYEKVFRWWDRAIPGLRSALPQPIPADAVY